MPELSTISPISHISFSVRDADKTVAWWQEVFGFDQIDTVESETWRSILLLLPPHIAIEFQEHESNRGEEFDPTRTGFDHMGWRVDSLEQLRSWQDRLAELGVEHTPIVEHDHGRGPMHVLTFKDPDRIQLEFFYWDRHP
jgi:glyoxylase I family protein